MGVLGTLGRRFMEDCIQPASRNQGHLLSVGMQSQFQDGVGSIAHELDLAVGKPSANQGDHLMSPHSYGLVPLAQLFTHLWSRGEYTQERQCPSQR